MFGTAVSLVVNLVKRSTNISEVAARQVIEVEIQGSSSIKGYHSMWQHLRVNYIKVKRDTVMRLLREIDPEGTQMRLTRGLQRRQYRSPGPNHIAGTWMAMIS